MNQMAKQFSPACERNQAAILTHLQTYLSDARLVLEIGSGTGQHAVYFSQRLPHLEWQTSDRIENHPSIQAWIQDHGSARVRAPIPLDVAHDTWPAQTVDAVFTANTCHIMSIAEVACMFGGASRVLNVKGQMIIYGPFNYNGKFTSASNQEFDTNLKMQAPHRGIRDIEEVQKIAEHYSLLLGADLDMPANNRLLVFVKNR
jgi:cyclopropane fatty-acyl-phospholipid synthase-like methyltransferase